MSPKTLPLWVGRLGSFSDIKFWCIRRSDFFFYDTPALKNLIIREKKYFVGLIIAYCMYENHSTFHEGVAKLQISSKYCDKVFLQHFHGFKDIFGTAESFLAITSGTSTTLPSRYWLGINDPCARYAQQWKCYQVVFLLDTVVFLAVFISPPSRTSLILFTVFCCITC